MVEEFSKIKFKNLVLDDNGIGIDIIMMTKINL